MGTAILPGWGTAIGAVGGGILGYLGSKGGKKTDPKNARFTDRDAILRELKEMRYRSTADAARVGQAPRLGQVALGQASRLDPSQQAQWREQQMAQAGRLGQIASGQMQGAGEIAAQRQAGRAMAQQQAMARMNRGMSQGTGARAAARGAMDVYGQAAGQSQIAALQDQQAANAQLGSLLGQGREADIGIAAQNAQMAQQRTLQQGTFDQQRAMQQGQMDQATQLANLQAELQQRGLNAQQQNAIMQQWLSMNQAEMAGRLGQEQVAMSQPGIAGPMLQAGGQVLAAYAGNQAASDKRAKKNIRHGGADVDEMLDLLKPTSYEYKQGVPEKYVGQLGDGRRIAGFLAQDLAKSKAGKSIVSTSPEGVQVVDVKGGMFAALAASARLHERVKELENGVKK